MKKPDPASGLVIRYDYLWRDEAAKGRHEGSKDRPCAVVVAHTDKHGRDQALIAAITHSEPPKGDGIEIPPRVKAHLGLDDDRSWIITSELNDVDWNDPGIVPATQTQWEYGYLPPKLAQDVLNAVRGHLATRKLATTARK